MIRKILGILASFIYTLVMLIIIYYGWFRWIWIGILIPISIFMGFLGFIIVVRPQSFVTSPTKKERIIIASIVSGVLTVLWIYSILFVL
jgi:hypothetical protein